MKKFSFFSVLLLLCMLVVPFQTSADDFVRGDCNLDGNVTISDVTCLIDYLLSDKWPGSGEPGEGEIETYVLNGIEIKMVKVEGGTFTMGASGTDTEANDDEYPAHSVTLSTYYIGQTEVTQQLWRAVMGNNPSYHTGDVFCPVEEVSWNDCQTFISKLNEMTGQNFRLPTEAEWEFAARGGNKSRGFMYAGSDDLNEVGWCNGGDSNTTTHPVATKLPNELGLYDMSGNVREWCSDRYGSYSAANQTDPQGPTSGTYRVHRGGGSGNKATACRITQRFRFGPSSVLSYLGLRLAM